MFHRASLKLGLDRAVLAHARNEGDGADGAAASAAAAAAESEGPVGSKFELQVSHQM